MFVTDAAEDVVADRESYITCSKETVAAPSVLMQIESQSHRGFSPMISSVTKQGSRLNGFSMLLGNANTALKQRCE